MALEKWRSEFMRTAGVKNPEKFPFIVLGNKCDKAAERQVDEGNARKWCESVGAEFFETSAKELNGVEEAFTKAVSMVIQNQADLS